MRLITSAAANLVQWQRSFVTGLLLEFPLLLWRRGSGRGGRLYRDFFVTILARFDLPKHWKGFPLSPRERAGVRGKETLAVRTPSASDLRSAPRPKGCMALS